MEPYIWPSGLPAGLPEVRGHGLLQNQGPEGPGKHAVGGRRVNDGYCHCHSPISLAIDFCCHETGHTVAVAPAAPMFPELESELLPLPLPLPPPCALIQTQAASATSSYPRLDLAHKKPCGPDPPRSTR